MLFYNSTNYMIDKMAYLGKGSAPNKTPVADHFVEIGSTGNI